MRKRKGANKHFKRRKQNQLKVYFDIETAPSAIVVSTPTGEYKYSPEKSVVVIEARSEHGHYDEEGNLTVTPLEVRTQPGYNPKEFGLDQFIFDLGNGTDLAKQVYLL